MWRSWAGAFSPDGTKAMVRTLPDCDVHRLKRWGRMPATYVTVWEPPGRDAVLAAMCPACYSMLGSGELGPGKGQQLLVGRDVPDGWTQEAG